MQHQNLDQTNRLLNWKKWTLAGVLFIGGYLTYAATAGQHGFFWEVAHHAGLFLSAVIAVHFIYELLIKKDEQAAMRREVSRAIASTVNIFLPSCQKWGFQGFLDYLDFNEIFGRLRDSDEFLWLDTYAPSRSVVVKHVTAALERGVKVRMLAIDPCSENAKLRAQEISQAGFNENMFLDDLNSFIGSLKGIKLNKANCGKPVLRLYSDLPGVPMYIHKRGGVPIAGFTSYYLLNASENFAHAKWTFADEGMLKYFSEYFESKWERAKPCYG